MPNRPQNYKNYIIIQGARVHNLKNINLLIPRDRFVVITGLSGSGKSSLAFDVLYSEGQRRYVESLSAYARQFLGKITKPDVDYIHGIPPAIAIQQRGFATYNPRSTVGTSTEIYEYLKLLYARIGKTFSPVSNREVKKHDVKDVIDFIMTLDNNLYIFILSPVVNICNDSVLETLENLLRRGFTRIEVNNQQINIEEIIKNIKIYGELKEFNIIIDRIRHDKSHDTISRVADSVQTAFNEGKGECIVKIINGSQVITRHFSDKFEEDGIIFEEPSVNIFGFNNPLGACPVCEGFGLTLGIDEDLVIPNKELSVYEGAISCWNGDVMSQWKDMLVYNATKFDFPIHKPIYQLSDEQKKLLWKGNEYFYGLNDFFQMLEKENYKIQYRVMLARYRDKTLCPACNGSRLKNEVRYVKIGTKSINELVDMPARKLLDFFQNIELSEYERIVTKRLLQEITTRLQFLVDVGLGYLTLNRRSSTLSGGESQRINLSTSLGSSLVGSLYILDEPSIGLHVRDTQLLIGVLRKLQKIGNSVIVVEHDKEIISSVDEIIDLGPGAGRNGGEVIFQGTIKDLEKKINDDACFPSLTGKYLTGKEEISVPRQRRNWNRYIEIIGASENNLKNINVKLPLHILTVITGVSGSGKSSLIKKIFYPALKRILHGYSEKPGKHVKLDGDIHYIHEIEFIDQNPIGKSSRSNPVTYLKAFDEIRKLFSEQPLSKRNGYKAAHFSFNIDGGRCDECQGEGIIKVEMQFMADVELICESCNGKRFKHEILDVEYRGKNIYDILEMTVDEAIDFFGAGTGNNEKRIVSKLRPLAEVGLGYVKLGQSSNTLSGGESQRIKLACFLNFEKSEPVIFIFDEPTTGLHFHDIRKLLESLNELINKGHTVVIIEHNPEIIKSADWLIDLGPEGGDEGGYIVYEGKPDGIIHCKNSYTGQFLKKELTN
ncbi:MAG: excinuclease ABC subunit UvrA [Bacteroidia bacterium]|nr:excinuclease ABC subunit UvrA [Bacteroidia bacterium]